MRTIIPILLLAISVGLFFTFIDPQYQKVKSLRVDRNKYSETLDTSNKVQKKKKDLQDANGQITEEQNRRLEILLPRRVESIKFIRDVNGIATDKGIFLENIKVGSGVSSRKNTAPRSPVSRNAEASVVGKGGEVLYVSTEFSFGFKSSYEVFKSFLRDLERSLKLTDVTGIAFSTNESNLYEFSLSGKIYSLE